MFKLKMCKLKVCKLKTHWRSLSALGLAFALVGCTSTAQMTQQQREGVELRRYCEQNPTDQIRCLGFLGFL